MNSDTSIYAAESEDLASPSRMKVSKLLDSAKSIPTLALCLESIGLESSTTETCETSLILQSATFLPLDGLARTSLFADLEPDYREKEAVCGERSLESWDSANRLFASLKIALCSKAEDLIPSKWIWKESATVSGHTWLTLGFSGWNKAEYAAGWLPTLCASEYRDMSRVRILASMDKGGRVARRICRERIGELDPSLIVGLHPSFAEEMIGLEKDHTVLNAAETQSFRQSLKSSRKKSTNHSNT